MCKAGSVIHWSNPPFGELRTTYTDANDLETTLAGLSEQIALIEKSVPVFTPTVQRLPKPGYEDYYRFTSDGNLELLQVPTDRLGLLALALFAYSPTMITAAEIEKVTGIKGAGDKVIHPGNNRKYFRSMKGANKSLTRYGLSDEGYRYVAKSFKRRGNKVEGESESGAEK